MRSLEKLFIIAPRAEPAYALLGGATTVTKQAAPEQHQFDIDVEERLILWQVRGAVTLDSLLKTVERLYAHPDYDPSFDGIIDIQTSDWRLDYVELNEYSQKINSSPNVSRGRTVLVAATPVAFGFARMYEGTRGKLAIDLHFEQTVEDAIAYLRSMSP